MRMSGRKMTRDELAGRLSWWVIKTVGSKDYSKEHRKNLKVGKRVRSSQTPLPFDLGDFVRFRCRECNAKSSFEFDGNRESLPKYCSQKCKSRSWKRSVRVRETLGKCPHPWKTIFFSGEVAEKYLLSLRRDDDSFHMAHIYVCECGKYHIGRIKYHK